MQDHLGMEGPTSWHTPCEVDAVSSVLDRDVQIYGHLGIQCPMSLLPTLTDHVCHSLKANEVGSQIQSLCLVLRCLPASKMETGMGLSDHMVK